MAAAEQHSQVESLLNESSPDLMLVGDHAACAYPLIDKSGYDSHTAVPYDRVAYPKPSAVGDLLASSFLLASNTTGIGMGQAGSDPTRQLRKPPSMFSLYSSKSQTINAGDHLKQKPRQSRFHIRQRIGKVFAGGAHE